MKHLNDQDLATMKALYDDVLLSEAELASKRAKFDLTLTQAFIEHGVLRQSHSLCLECGTLNRRDQPCAGCTAGG